MCSWGSVLLGQRGAGETGAGETGAGPRETPGAGLSGAPGRPGRLNSAAWRTPQTRLWPWPWTL